MKRISNFTEGAILAPLLKFMLPVLAAMFLQAMYGAADLLVVGHFADNTDVSAVSTGSQIVLTLTNLIVSFAMGVTVTIGKRIGEKRTEDAVKTVGTGIVLFLIIGFVFTLISVFGATFMAKALNAPKEAFALTIKYIRICGAGFVIIVAYNVLGSMFRGLGDSKTPLIAVAIACVFNIVGDIVFVACFHMGAGGAAYATVMAQLLSVIISLVLIRNRLPFEFHLKDIRIDKSAIYLIVKMGLPIALQDFLVGISFLVLQAVVNLLGVNASAGVGVAEKVCAFIMLVPSAFMQSMSSFVAQNIGAAKPDRARKALKYGIMVSFAFGASMFFLTFFHGDLLAEIFSKNTETIANAFEYLKAYAIDCLLTCFLFCFIGYYNGVGNTKFVMLQGICGAFLVRIPVALVMSRMTGSLFLIGLATPCSTIIQIIMCFIVFGNTKNL